MGYYSIFRSTIAPTHHWSDASLIRRWSEAPLVRRSKINEDYKVITCLLVHHQYYQTLYIVVISELVY